MAKIGIFERNETFSYWITIRDRNGAKVDPTWVKETIYDPCNHEILSAQAMTKDVTGVYYYDTQLSSTATYGRYRVLAESLAGTGQYSRQMEEFFVMPYKLEDSVRRKVGLDDDKDISDDDLSHISWTSYKEALREIYAHHYGEIPRGNPDTGVGFNGTNTSFQTSHFPIADIGGDGSVTGTDAGVAGTNYCEQDIKCWWINSAGSRVEGRVNVDNYRNGELSIYQEGVATAIPSNHEGVYIDYWSQYDSYDEFLFREAVAYLAAHYVNLRLTERDNVTLADIRSNQPIILKQPNRFYKEYRRILKLIRKPKITGHGV